MIKATLKYEKPESKVQADETKEIAQMVTDHNRSGCSVPRLWRTSLSIMGARR